jgi:hypothetical protein
MVTPVTLRVDCDPQVLRGIERNLRREYLLYRLPVDARFRGGFRFAVRSQFTSRKRRRKVGSHEG